MSAARRRPRRGCDKGLDGDGWEGGIEVDVVGLAPVIESVGVTFCRKPVGSPGRFLVGTCNGGGNAWYAGGD